MWGKCVLGRKMSYFGDLMGYRLETEGRESGRRVGGRESGRWVGGQATRLSHQAPRWQEVDSRTRLAPLL